MRFTVAQDPTCAEYTDCETCVTNDPKCGWCSATQTCSAGNATGPTAGLCIHAWEYGVCRECEKNTDCRSCNHYDSECFWCRAKRSCLPIGYIGCAYADSCPCEEYTSCSSCNGIGCNWCSNLELCLEKVNTTHPCQHDTQCLCDGNPNCGSCMSDPTCGWCDDSRSCVHRAGSMCNTTFSCEFSCSRAGKSCDVCTKVDGCGWCAKTDTCMDINTNIGTCDVSIQCAGGGPAPCPKKKFDSGSFVGGMFLSIGVGLIFIAIFVFYKKRQNKQYTQL